MALLSLPQTVLAFRYLWLSRFLRLKQSVPAQICHRRLVCQACVPLSPLCLPYSPFVSSSVSLLLPAAAAWLGFLFCSTAESSWVLLFWKECESVWLPKSLSGDLGGQSPKIWFRTSFGPRLHLVRTSLKLQPVKTQPGEVLERLCNGLLLLLLLLLVLLLLGKARFLGREARDFVWRKRCAMRCTTGQRTWMRFATVHSLSNIRIPKSSIPYQIPSGKPPETFLQIIIQTYLRFMCGDASWWGFGKFGIYF